MGQDLIMARLVLLDTDILVDFFRGHNKAVAFVNAHSARIILSTIVIAELKTLNTKHYPMLKNLRPAYSK
jgi:predicted nucleic acid-binding protein